MPEDWDDDEGYWRFMSEPLSCNRGNFSYIPTPVEDKPEPLGSLFNEAGAKWGDVDEDGYHFSSSTINADGEQCVTWQKDWEFLGMTILREKHGKLCECSYCEKKGKGNWGITLPKCKCRNAWRIIWWRKGKWPYQYHYLRWTLPMYPFVWWRCRYCRKQKKLSTLG